MLPELRGYQSQAIYAARMHFVQGKRSVLLVSPTGSGKTTIGSHIAAGHVAKGGRVLWVAHRRELVDQAAKRLREYQLDVSVWPYNGTANVVVASIQGLLATNDKPLATLVILDEAHHYVSDGWAQEMSAYADCHKVGLTATPARGDGVGLGNAFDALHIVTTIKTLTDSGHLVPLEIITPPTALDSKHIAQCPIDAYDKHAKGLRTVVFAPNLEMAQTYADKFGGAANILHHKLPRAAREQLLAAHATDGRILINVGILTEGWDSPSTECVILARNCGSQSLYTQIAGRILRPAEGKQRALLIDLHGSCHRLGRPDEDKTYSLEGRGIRRTTDTDVRFCAVCGAVLDVDREDCVDCGYTRPDYKPPVVTNDPLIKYAHKRRETMDSKIATVAKWIQDAKLRKHHYGTVFHKYSAVYGETLSQDMFRKSLDMCGSVKKKVNVIEMGSIISKILQKKPSTNPFSARDVMRGNKIIKDALTANKCFSILQSYDCLKEWTHYLKIHQKARAKCYIANYHMLELMQFDIMSDIDRSDNWTCGDIL